MTVLILGVEPVDWRDALDRASSGGTLRKPGVDRHIAPVIDAFVRDPEGWQALVGIANPCSGFEPPDVAATRPARRRIRSLLMMHPPPG